MVTRSPAPGASAVAVTTPVSATFSEALSCATVNGATFTLAAGSAGVAGNVSCAGATATFTPTAPLQASKAYTATLTTGVQDLAGNGLAAPVSWSFTTAGGGGTFTISGTVSATAGQVADLDTADPHMAGNNDAIGVAQQLPSTATVGGWASNATDGFDYYRASLGAGQTLTLLTATPTADLDLCMALVADTSQVACSTNDAGLPEQLTIPAGGAEVYIEVSAFSGASNYLLVLGQAPAAAGPAIVLGQPMVAGELVVRFKDGYLAAEARSGGATTLAAKAASMGLVPLAGAALGRPALLGLDPAPEGRARALATLGAKVPSSPLAAGASPEAALRLQTLAAIQALRTRADVASADPNFVFQPEAVPNDEFYPLQWHYPLIQLPQAWDVTTGTPATGSVVVAVVDTGVVLSHPDLAGQLVAGYDFVSSTAMSNDGDGIDANPNDPGDGGATGQSSFHGTHVTGTIAARTNNGIGVAGVSWGAKVMPVRVLGKGGGTSYDIMQGIRFAAGLSNDSGTVPAKKADVMNLSLGCSNCFSSTEQAEYTNVRNAGVIVVAAAGNENTTLPGYPASYTGVVSVSAVDMLVQKAPYSNSGPNVDVAAPGGDTSVDRDGNGYVDGVLSTLVQQDAATPIYSFYQGTSMASPHMAGVVALMKAVCTTLTPAQLDTLLSSGQITDDQGPAGRDDVFGWGLINALKAVQAAQGQCGGTPAPGFAVDPASLDFGNATTQLPLAVTKVGTGVLAVTSVTDNAAWLDVAAGTVDADGFGTYTATVSRTGLAAGSYAARITVTAGGKSATANVTLQVGAAPSTTGDVGYLYLLALDTSFTPVGQAEGAGTAGQYAWQFTGVPEGAYYLVAGTDSDGNDAICDAAEACGAWPTLGLLTPVGVAGNLTGIDFGVGFDTGLALQSTRPVGWPAGGFPIHRAPSKTFGGAR